MPKPLLLASLELHPPLARPTAHMGYQEWQRVRNFAAVPRRPARDSEGGKAGRSEEDVRGARRTATAPGPCPSAAF